MYLGVRGSVLIAVRSAGPHILLCYFTSSSDFCFPTGRDYCHTSACLYRHLMRDGKGRSSPPICSCFTSREFLLFRPMSIRLPTAHLLLEEFLLFLGCSRAIRTPSSGNDPDELPLLHHCDIEPDKGGQPHFFIVSLCGKCIHICEKKKFLSFFYKYIISHNS